MSKTLHVHQNLIFCIKIWFLIAKVDNWHENLTSKIKIDIYHQNLTLNIKILQLSIFIFSHQNLSQDFVSQGASHKFSGTWNCRKKWSPLEFGLGYGEWGTIRNIFEFQFELGHDNRSNTTMDAKNSNRALRINSSQLFSSKGILPYNHFYPGLNFPSQFRSFFFSASWDKLF